MNGNVIIIGAGRVGSSIAALLNEQNYHVTVIDKNKDALMNVEDFTGYFEVADASNIEVLQRIGIKNADVVVISTEDDDTNVFLTDVCHFVFGVPRIFVRLADAQKERLCRYPSVRAILPFLLSLDEFSREFQSAVLNAGSRR